MSTVYSALKAFGFPERLGSLRDGPAAAPVHVRVKPINACNQRCWFCAYRAPNLDLGNEMRLADRIPPTKMQELVQDFASMGVKAVTFSGGGEPLLHPSFGKTIQELARLQIQVGCLTNGSLLTGDLALAAATACTWIRVSMDGWDAESYSKSRAVGNHAFGSVMANIRNFARIGGSCALGVSFIVTAENAPHIFDFCEQAKEAGVQSVKISGCVVSNKGDENHAYHRLLATTARKEIDRCHALSGANFSIVDHYHDQMTSFEKRYNWCPGLGLLTVIGADCDVYACQDKAYTTEGRLGSIKEQSFREFWTSTEAAEARKRIRPSIDCKHHCVANQKNLLLTEYLDLSPTHAAFV